MRPFRVYVLFELLFCNTLQMHQVLWRVENESSELPMKKMTRLLLCVLLFVYFRGTTAPVWFLRNEMAAGNPKASECLLNKITPFTSASRFKDMKKCHENSDIRSSPRRRSCFNSHGYYLVRRYWVRYRKGFRNVIENFDFVSGTLPLDWTQLLPHFITH